MKIFKLPVDQKATDMDWSEQHDNYPSIKEIFVKVISLKAPEINPD